MYGSLDMGSDFVAFGKVGYRCWVSHLLSIPLDMRNKPVMVAGTLYHLDTYEYQSIFYLKQAVLINQTNKSIKNHTSQNTIQKEYPLDGIKVTVKQEKSSRNTS